MVKVCVVDVDDPKCRPCLTPKPVSCAVCQKAKETTSPDGVSNIMIEQGKRAFFVKVFSHFLGKVDDARCQIQ